MKRSFSVQLVKTVPPKMNPSASYIIICHIIVVVQGRGGVGGAVKISNLSIV